MEGMWVVSILLTWVAKFLCNTLLSFGDGRRALAIAAGPAVLHQQSLLR